jgi:membrane protease YdiL (CAAX protease family)
MSWLIPVGYALLAYLVVWTVGWGAFPNHAYMDQITKRMGIGLSPGASSLLYLVLIGTFGMAGSLSNALGEEIGWRGFLVPELSKTFSFTATSLISGVVWAAWHAPILVGGDYNAGTSAGYALTCFAVLVISMSFVFAWMRLASGSLWTAALLHASHNLYIQSIFTPFTRDTGRTAWYIDEFGAVLPVVTVCVAIYFWSRRKELTVLSDGQPIANKANVASAL